MARRPFDGQVIISQEYGTPNSMYRKGYHTGVDYALSRGHKLVSPTVGKVLEVGFESSQTNGRGHYVVIQGNDGVTHHIYHMQVASPLSKSTPVAEGTHIGYVGSTGASTGPHLHWETRRDGVDFAPGSWLFAGQPVYTPPTPAPTQEYVRIFGDYRTLYNLPGGSRKAVLAPNLWLGGKLDYIVLARSGNFVQIQTSFFGKGWIYVGSDVASLTQFFRA